MTPAERLAKLPGCWRPGTLGVFASGVGQVGWIHILRVGPDGAVYSWVDDGGWIGTATDGEADLSEYVPDLTDPATVGCLAAWCREVYGVPSLHAAILMGRKSPTGGPIWTITDGIRYVMVWTDLGLGQVSEERIGDAWAAAILAKLEAP